MITGQVTHYYGHHFNVGNTASNASAEQSASNLVLRQLNDQRSSVSGVSLDEEAANLMRYQQAYAASAQVVSTINSMLETVINMKSSGNHALILIRFPTCFPPFRRRSS